MWFKNLKVFRLPGGFALSADQLSEALEKLAFRSGSASEMQSMGWIPSRANGGLVHAVNGQYLLSLRVEKKLLPSTVVNQFAKARAAEIEEQQGYKPGCKQMKEIKERVADELLPKAFTQYHDTRAWIDPSNRWLVIDAGSPAKADEVLGMLGKCINPFPVESLYVAQSPAAAMTGWLAADEAPQISPSTKIPSYAPRAKAAPPSATSSTPLIPTTRAATSSPASSARASP